MDIWRSYWGNDRVTVLVVHSTLISNFLLLVLLSHYQSSGASDVTLYSVMCVWHIYYFIFVYSWISWIVHRDIEENILLQQWQAVWDAETATPLSVFVTMLEQSMAARRATEDTYCAG
jgi:hypothetical protein